MSQSQQPTQRTSAQQELQALRAEHDRQVKKENARKAELLAQSRKHTDDAIVLSQERWRLNAELMKVKQQNDDEIELAYRRDGRRRRSGMGLEPTLAQREELLEEIVEGDQVYRDDPDVTAWRTWITGVCQREKIEVCEWRDPRLHRGLALRGRRSISVAPVQSLKTAAVCAHEVGHCVVPDRPDAIKRKTESGNSVCVSNEIDAWKWVARNAPSWTEGHHRFMASCLLTYRPYASESERFEVDWFVGNVGFREMRLARTLQRKA